jgi:hypothetical protein
MFHAVENDASYERSSEKVHKQLTTLSYTYVTTFMCHLMTPTFEWRPSTSRQ